MKTEKQETAADAYAERRSLITRQLAQLERRLARLDEQHRASPANWAIVGTLGAVQERLDEVVRMLGGYGDHEEVTP